MNNSSSLSDFDEVLWAIGRSPNISELGLGTVGVELTSSGDIKVDEWQNTTAENIYALGDVCGKALLTPVAIAAGRKCKKRKSNFKFKNSF